MDIAALVISGLSMLGTLTIAYVTFRNFPTIAEKMRKTEFVADELSELLQKGAKGPEDYAQEVRDVANPVLLKMTRTGRHDPVFDRIVFEFVGDLPSYEIKPLTQHDLSAQEVLGKWGLSVRLEQCRIRYNNGPSDGLKAINHLGGSPDLPTIADYRLVKDEGNACEWVIGCRIQGRYLPYTLHQNGSPRLVVDFYRKFST